MSSSANSVEPIRSKPHGPEITFGQRLLGPGQWNYALGLDALPPSVEIADCSARSFCATCSAIEGQNASIARLVLVVIRTR